VLTVMYAFPHMSYYYGSMFVVIEGWKILKSRSPKNYRDKDIDTLVKSRFVDQLRHHRNGAISFHTELL
jgi:tRNA A-37 threonylcarbamoyl transferase component Bud32